MALPKPQSYSRTQIILHWVIVLLVLFQFVANEQITNAWHARLDGTIANMPSFSFHAAFGMLTLVLMIWRIWLRFSHGAPALPENEPAWSRILAHAAQGLLYLLLLLLPISGGAAWFIGIQPAAIAHGVMTKLTILFVAVHIAGALFQHFVIKSNVLMRMLGRP